MGCKAKQAGSCETPGSLHSLENNLRAETVHGDNMTDVKNYPPRVWNTDT